MIVTFCGHRDTYDADGEVGKWLRTVIEQLIAEGATEFYLGGYGRFDALAAQAVREAKKDHACEPDNGDVHFLSTFPLPNE